MMPMRTCGPSGLATEVQLDLARPLDRQLALRRVEVHARQAQPEPALKDVAGAAREDREPRADVRVAGHRTHARRIALERRDTGTGPYLGAGCGRSAGQRAIERWPIDHGGQRCRRIVVNGDARRRDEPRRRQRVQQRVARQIEFVEAFGREHPGAVNGIAANRMLFADDRVHASPREALGDEQPAGAAPDDEHVGRIIGHELPPL